MNLNKATLVSKKDLTYDVVELKFKPENSDVFLANFKAGQFVSIKIPGEEITFRSYSVSGVTDEGEFELCVKVVEGGSGSNFLKNLAQGEEIEFLGPNGHFTFTSAPDKKIGFIATGTGIAPIKAMIEEQLKNDNKKEIGLAFGVRYVKDLFYEDLMEEWASKYPNFQYMKTVSRPVDPSWNGFTGRVTDLLKTKEFDPNITEVYICGLKEMVDETTQILKEKGLSEKAIHFERFN